MGSSCTIVTLWPLHEKASVGRCCGAASAGRGGGGAGGRGRQWCSAQRQKRHKAAAAWLVFRGPRAASPVAQGMLRMASFISRASASCPTAERSTWRQEGQAEGGRLTAARQQLQAATSKGAPGRRALLLALARTPPSLPMGRKGRQLQKVARLEQQRDVHSKGDLVVVAALALEALLLKQHRLPGGGRAGACLFLAGLGCSDEPCFPTHVRQQDGRSACPRQHAVPAPLPPPSAPPPKASAPTLARRAVTCSPSVSVTLWMRWTSSGDSSTCAGQGANVQAQVGLYRQRCLRALEMTHEAGAGGAGAATASH